MATFGGYSADAPTEKQKVVVIVDPYSSGRYLVAEIKNQLWKMVCVQSSQDLADFWLGQHEPENFIETIKHETLESTVAALSAYDVAAAIPGSEPGVLLAEDLQEALNLQGNGASTKDWRRNKYNQQERLREVGVRAIRQLYSSDVNEMLQWQEQWGAWPIIVKPSMSGGTDGVYWCHSKADVEEAHAAECGKLNCNGVINDKLLVQEYLDGLEYVIDCVSFEGKHVLSGIWVYKKIKDTATKSITYEYAQFLDSKGEIQDQLVDYIFKCLDALDFKYGPSHSEAIMCADGPCLVETGARLHGLKGPKMTEFATGLGTHELVVDVVLNGGRIFSDLHARNHRYIVKKWVFETMMNNSCKEGILAESLDTPELRKLHSVMDVLPTVKPGEQLKITRDLATAPGIILMVHSSLQRCFDDLDVLRNLEKCDLYKVTAGTSQSGKASASPNASPRRASGVTSPYQFSPVSAPARPLAMSADDFELVGLNIEG